MGVTSLVRGTTATRGVPRHPAPVYTYYRLPRCVVFCLGCGMFGVVGVSRRVFRVLLSGVGWVRRGGGSNCPQGRKITRGLLSTPPVALSVSRPLFCVAAHDLFVCFALAGSCHSRFRTLTFVGSMRWGMRVLPTFPCVRPALCNEGTPTECSMGCVGSRAEGESARLPVFILHVVRGICCVLAYCRLRWFRGFYRFW